MITLTLCALFLAAFGLAHLASRAVRALRRVAAPSPTPALAAVRTAATPQSTI